MSGVDTTGDPVSAAVVNEGNSTNPNLTMSAATGDDWIIGHVATNAVRTFSSPPDIVIHDASGETYSTHIGAKDSGDGSNLSWTANSTVYWGTIGFTITGESAGESIDATAGAYALTGILTKFDIGMPATAGSYSKTGAVANFDVAMPATAGSYTKTGAAATLLHDALMDAIAGSYSKTGFAALTLVGRIIEATAGSYTKTGVAATLLHAALIDAIAGSYDKTGADATLLYSPVGGEELTVDAGSYALTGAIALLLVGRAITATAGSYSKTGATASLLHDAIIDALEGSYTYTGTLMLFDIDVSALAAAYTLTGRPTTLVYSGEAITAYAGILTDAISITHITRLV
jgi:hypothetical protein